MTYAERISNRIDSDILEQLERQLDHLNTLSGDRQTIKQARKVSEFLRSIHRAIKDEETDSAEAGARGLVSYIESLGGIIKHTKGIAPSSITMGKRRNVIYTNTDAKANHQYALVLLEVCTE